ncbi:unnamed protein product [Kluyveromyces dobzhanskii CBS 2104]|uniref:WGS project CCBQ000000000 data, contig 00058 n=1 Tax=Kluyveromyces dobzhanskii CBS 2104 TaxID=1427455 RepID=A0A0A8LDC4_9SACH|nr:unnamed protein product [Kluyveromyces dobzhanskii CBS 2104]
MPLRQVRLGSSGLKISPIVVGCMSYGSKDWSAWVQDDKEKIFSTLKFCYDNGLRTFDTADMYSNGLSEKLLGEFLRKFNIRRETVVILTKVYFPVDEEISLKHGGGNLSEHDILDLTNQQGLSRKHILAGVAASCKRLGTYIDVLQIHRLDHDTSMEEVMRSLNHVVESGQVHYIGASTMLATEFVELQSIADKFGWHKFISSQSCYNLLYREDERELIPYLKKHGVGIIPWSPNARGILCRPVSQQSESTRFTTDRTITARGFDDLQTQDVEIINRVEELAKKHGVSMAVVSSAWVLAKGAFPIVGLSSVDRVKEIILATELQLSEEEIKYLEQPYLPKPLIC